jgi:hypothetical protein
MNDFSLTQELLKQNSQNSTLYLSIIIFVSINIVTSIANIIIQIALKNKDKTNYRYQIREDRRVKIFEIIGFKLDELSYFDGKSNNTTFQNKVSELCAFIQKNKIHINKATKRIVMDFVDYFEEVINNPLKKDYKIEFELFNAFSSEFNK